jgi:hypothetical protein
MPTAPVAMTMVPQVDPSSSLKRRPCDDNWFWCKLPAGFCSALKDKLFSWPDVWLVDFLLQPIPVLTVFLSFLSHQFSILLLLLAFRLLTPDVIPFTVLNSISSTPHCCPVHLPFPSHTSLVSFSCCSQPPLFPFLLNHCSNVSFLYLIVRISLPSVLLFLQISAIEWVITPLMADISHWVSGHSLDGQYRPSGGCIHSCNGWYQPSGEWSLPQ